MSILGMVCDFGGMCNSFGQKLGPSKACLFFERSHFFFDRQVSRAGLAILILKISDTRSTNVAKINQIHPNAIQNDKNRRKQHVLKLCGETFPPLPSKVIRGVLPIDVERRKRRSFFFFGWKENHQVIWRSLNTPTTFDPGSRKRESRAL